MVDSQLSLNTVIRMFVMYLLASSSEEMIYLSDTDDGSSIEFYDCISYSNFQYCRRPSTPLDLERDHFTGRCENNGILRSFASLASKNISIHTIQHQWGSSVDMSEEYSRYLEDSTKSNAAQGRYLCQCTNLQSFGNPSASSVNICFRTSIPLIRQSKLDCPMAK